MTTTTQAAPDRSDLIGLTARNDGDRAGWDARIYRRADGPLGIRLHQWSRALDSLSGEVAVTPLLPADLTAIEAAEAEARACGDEPRQAATAALADIIAAIQQGARTWRVICRPAVVR